ncbi:MAG: hypothetical protein ACE5LU_00550 [Anaerolineae bacterium]
MTIDVLTKRELDSDIIAFSPPLGAGENWQLRLTEAERNAEA